MKKLLTTIVVTLAPAMAFAEEAAATAGGDRGWIALAAGIAAGVAVLGGTLSQGRAVAAALESIGRNPASAKQIQTPMILGLALIESLVILAWIIAFFLQGKV